MSGPTLDVEALGAQLERAWNDKTPIPPLSESVNLSDIDDAYRVQGAFTSLRLAAGDRIVGRKIGLTSAAVQQQLGVDQPDFGNLWASRYFKGAGDQIEVRADLFLQPRVEGELAFLIGSPLRGPGVGLVDVLAATEAVAYSLEIVDSRIENWRIRLADTVADNASFGGFCHADWQPELLTRDLSTLNLTLSKNGQPAGTGSGAACLGNPALAVAWLVNTLARFDVSLEPGDLVMSGAWMPVVPAAQGDVFVLEGEGSRGPLTLRFT